MSNSMSLQNLQVIPPIHDRCALYKVSMYQEGWFPGKSMRSLFCIWSVDIYTISCNHKLNADQLPDELKIKSMILLKHYHSKLVVTGRHQFTAIWHAWRTVISQFDCPFYNFRSFLGWKSQWSDQCIITDFICCDAGLNLSQITNQAMCPLKFLVLHSEGKHYQIDLLYPIGIRLFFTTCGK